MVLYGGERDSELFGNLAIAKAQRDEACHVALAQGEHREQFAGETSIQRRTYHDHRAAKFLDGVEIDR